MVIEDGRELKMDGNWRWMGRWDWDGWGRMRLIGFFFGRLLFARFWVGFVHEYDSVRGMRRVAMYARDGSFIYLIICAISLQLVPAFFSSHSERDLLRWIGFIEMDGIYWDGWDLLRWMRIEMDASWDDDWHGCELRWMQIEMGIEMNRIEMEGLRWMGIEMDGKEEAELIGIDVRCWALTFRVQPAEIDVNWYWLSVGPSRFR